MYSQLSKVQAEKMGPAPGICLSQRILAGAVLGERLGVLGGTSCPTLLA